MKRSPHGQDQKPLAHSRRKAFYRPEDAQSIDYDCDLGDPGQFPFTRGVHRQMYSSRLWTMRQYAGYATAQEANRRYRYLLAQGTTGLSVAFDLPTQIGLDSDHPLACGEVGKVGVAIDSLEDMECLLKGIPLDKVSLSMTINATAHILLALYLATARRRSVPWARLRGTLQNDILKEYVARGTYIYPPGPSLRLITDIFEFCSKEVPQLNPISISGYHIREAGSTAAQEVAFAIANGETYVKSALEAGLELDEFAPRLSFFFAVHNDLFEEVSKFRSARRMWARLMRDRLGAREKKSWMLRFHAQTGGSTLTAQQPDNNIVRVSLQALAAVLGGAQSLHTNSKDEALALPSEQAASLALRTQQILAHESGLSEVVDPLGGSWYVERRTAELEQEASAYLEKIHNLGGVLPAIAQGYLQREIQESAYQKQKAFESARTVLVGVNRFIEEESPTEVFRLNPEMEKQQIARLRELRRNRSAARVRSSLKRVREVATSGQNIMPAVISAVEGCATVGEIGDVLREIFGEHRETIVI